MKVKVWGCRGSLAAPGPRTVKYGGNTSCVQVILEDETLLILDAGTGLMRLGLDLDMQKISKVHLLLSHLHLDHIQGMGFFGPAFTHDIEFIVWGPPSARMNLEARIERYLSEPLFPVHVSQMSSELTFRNVPDGSWNIGGATITSELVMHAGVTLGYRIEEAGRSLTYIPDHEPARPFDLTTVEAQWVSGHTLAQETDVLFHDSQYTDEEYSNSVGFGHSSVRDSVAFAQLARARKLIMFHHDPRHDDEQLDELAKLASSLWTAEGSPPEMAFEGMEFELKPAASGTAAVSL